MRKTIIAITDTVFDAITDALKEGGEVHFPDEKFKQSVLLFFR